MYPHENACRFSGAQGQNSLLFRDQHLQISFQCTQRDLNVMKKAIDEEIVWPLLDKYA